MGAGELDAESVVRPVIDRLFPSANQVVRLSAGWDSTAYVVDEQWIVRIPKRGEVARQVQHERNVLRMLSVLNLPLTVPSPVETDCTRPSVMVYRMIHGVPYAKTGWKEHSPLRRRVLQQVMDFLQALHRVPISDDAGVRPFPWTGIRYPAASGDSSVNGWRMRLAQFGFAAVRAVAEQDKALAARIEEAFSAFVADKAHFVFEPCLIHGDFSPDHVLVDPQTGEVAGIIDWGDSGIGDPAYDLWPSMLEAEAVDSPVRSRCAFYRRIAPLHALLFALQTNDHALQVTALDGIRSQFPD